MKKFICERFSGRQRGKHLYVRKKRGIAGFLFPDVFAKHMAVDR